MVLKTSYLRGMNLASFYIASKITVFMTFMTYVLLGNPISASRVFVAVSLYGAVRLTVTLFFPAAIEKVSEALVSVRRIKVLPKGDIQLNLMAALEIINKLVAHAFFLGKPPSFIARERE